MSSRREDIAYADALEQSSTGMRLHIFNVMSSRREGITLNGIGKKE